MPENNLRVFMFSLRSKPWRGHGLQSQESRCRDYAAAKDYEVMAAFLNTITGGGDFMQRPGMKALLAYLDAQPDENFIVIFDDLKRLASDTRAHLDLREAFRNRGAKTGAGSSRRRPALLQRAADQINGLGAGAYFSYQSIVYSD